MSYFKWFGVDITGKILRGKSVSYSPQELDERLFLRGIALLSCKKIYVLKFFWPITNKLKADTFAHVAQLLKAGMLLPDVLRVVSQQTQNPFLCDMIAQLRIDIMQGLSLSMALGKQKFLCDSIAATLLIAGDQSAHLASAFDRIALYYEMQHSVKKKIMSALAMPLLTFLFFIGISVFIFVVIIPRFADIFLLFNHQLPLLTRIMVMCSDFIRSYKFLAVLTTVVFLLCVLNHFFKLYGKKWQDRIKLRIFFIGPLLYKHFLSQILYALSLLVAGGVTLSDALQLLVSSSDNQVIKREIEHLYHDVLSGHLFSDALERSSLFLPEIVSLIVIGEESGVMTESLEKAAHLYFDSLQQSLARFIFFLQPLVIIILGLLVATLIFSVYLPIMNLSHII